MSTLKVDTLTTTDDANSIATERVANGTAAAWVVFNGNDTPITVYGSYNVSSVTDNGTGDYTVNFTNSMVDANYLPVPHCGTESSTNIYTISTTVANKTTTSIRVTNNSANGTNIDTSVAGLAVFR